MAFKIQYEGKIIGNNQRYAYRTKKINSKEYETFKQYIAWLCKDQNRNESLIESKVEVMVLYNSGLDIDNLLKGIFDSLQGIAYNKDSQIKKAMIQECKEIPKGFFMVINELPNNSTTNTDAVSANVCT